MFRNVPGQCGRTGALGSRTDPTWQTRPHTGRRCSRPGSHFTPHITAQTARPTSDPADFTHSIGLKPVPWATFWPAECRRGRHVGALPLPLPRRESREPWGTPLGEGMVAVESGLPSGRSQRRAGRSCRTTANTHPLPDPPGPGTHTRRPTSTPRRFATRPIVRQHVAARLPGPGDPERAGRSRPRHRPHHRHDPRPHGVGQSIPHVDQFLKVVRQAWPGLRCGPVMALTVTPIVVSGASIGASGRIAIGNIMRTRWL